MPTGAITEYIDVAQITLYVFWLFFFGLILYLRREDSREGYPLEADVGGRVRAKNIFFLPKPKEFIRPHNQGSLFAPNDERDTREVKATRMAPWPGAAYVPTGDPMVDGLGPAAWAERPKQPDLDLHGKNLIVPLRNAENEGFSIAAASRDPRGFEVLGMDDVVAGRVTDIWFTKAEKDVRYLEVDVSGKGSVLLPIGFARVDMDKPQVTVRAIKGEQFARVPTLAKGDEVTLDEEERIQAFYGGGYFYADPKRAEPLV